MDILAEIGRSEDTVEHLRTKECPCDRSGWGSNFNVMNNISTLELQGLMSTLTNINISKTLRKMEYNFLFNMIQNIEVLNFD